MKYKIIFLDIDGVLNGYNKFTEIVYWIRRLFHIEKFIDKIYDPCGVHKRKVKLLVKIIKKTNARIVLSSSWRGAYWSIPYQEKKGNLKKLTDLFVKYGIIVHSITPKSKDHRRDTEILDWLDIFQGQVDKYIVIDDEPTDLGCFIDNGTLIQTSSISRDKMICGNYKENTGLKRKHVKQAIKILEKRDK